jgi:hypothetical protein
MIELQYFNGKEWVTVEIFYNERIAWISLGGDDFNYRTVDSITPNLFIPATKFRIYNYMLVVYAHSIAVIQIYFFIYNYQNTLKNKLHLSIYKLCLRKA